jgi:hypothetical protein
MPLRDDEKHKHRLVLAAEYFHKLDCWLDAHFEGLKTLGDWGKFYVHLVRILVMMANADANKKQKFVIVEDDIVMPKEAHLFKACRLLFQAVVKHRIAVPDGQHRMAAMVELLSGWKITLDPKRMPPKGFEPGDHCGIVGNYEIGPPLRRAFSKILEALCGKVVVRVILPPQVFYFEPISIEYSRVREESQSKHKPRVLVDVYVKCEIAFPVMNIKQAI